MEIKRKPSIHIEAEKLVEIIISTLYPNGFPVNVSWDKPALEKELLKRAKKYTLSNRSLLATNQKQRQQASKVAATPNENAMAFAKVVFYQRKLAKHMGISIASSASKDWLPAKVAAGLATEFCEEFHLSKEQGYKTYASIGISKMQRFNYEKFPGIHTAICETYEALTRISEDPNKALTQRAHNAYIEYLVKRTGMFDLNYEKMPEKYVYFVKLAELCKDKRISPEVYIKSQFEFFSFKNGVPDPTQLVGDKALERYSKYIYETGNKEAEEESKPKIDFKKLRKLR